MTSWILFIWLGGHNPVVIQDFSTKDKCVAMGENIKSIRPVPQRVGYECLKVEK